MEVDPATEARPRLFAWFANPWVGIVGTIASILGVILAIYFYSTSVKMRQLIVTTDPAFSIVKSGQTGSIDVIYKGQPITTDVYVCRMYIWNAGSESIRRDNILEPIQIELNPTAPILDATIRKVSRPVTNIVLDTSQLDKGKLSISWKLLERNDGAMVDVIYASDKESKLQVAGVIEEQPQVRTRTYRTSTRDYEKRKFILFGLVFLIVVGVIALVLVETRYFRLLKSIGTPIRHINWILPLAVSLFTFIFALIVIAQVFAVDTTPPVF